MKNMTIENITKACNGKFYGDKSLLDKEITGVEKDSRLIEEGYSIYTFCWVMLWMDINLFHQCF